jgi:hypothetical protein
MQNVQYIIGELEIIKRMKNSYNGNPRYLVRINGRHYRTKPDSMLGYSVTNYSNKQVCATVGLHYGVHSIETVKAI